ncbi:MAG: hypothetical protein ACRC0V_01675 [Fusobacteriaceae bacterium]
MNVYIILGGILSEDGEPKCSEIIGVFSNKEAAHYQCFGMDYVDVLMIDGIEYLCFDKNMKIKNDKLLKINSLLKIRKIVEKEVIFPWQNTKTTIPLRL